MRLLTIALALLLAACSPSSEPQPDRLVILAYVIGAATAGLGGVLFALDVNSVQPAVHGNFYELYAIAAAVLGGTATVGLEPAGGGNSVTLTGPATHVATIEVTA